jgi:hypothetical protein
MMTLLLSSCEKEPLKDCINDPDCEYFRCKINGEWWTPDCEEGPLFGCRHTDVLYYKNSRGGSLEMNTSSKKNNDVFVFRLWNLKEANIDNSYVINGKIYTRYVDKTIDKRFYVDTTNFNEFILISLDTVGLMMNAKFSFTGKDESGKTVSITEGSFRLGYRF